MHAGMYKKIADLPCTTGPAFKSGIIQAGDTLHEIDGVPVLQLTPAQVSPLMLGPKGSNVMLAFLRGNDKIVANLERQWPANAIT